MARASAACRRLMTILRLRSPDCARLHWPQSMIRGASADWRDIHAYFGLVSKALSVWRGRLHRQHLGNAGMAGAEPLPVRSRQCHADPLQGPAQLKAWAFAIAKRSTMRKARVAPARRLDHHACDAGETRQSSYRPKPSLSRRQEAKSSSQEERRSREEQTTARILQHAVSPMTDCDFNRAGCCTQLLDPIFFVGDRDPALGQ